MKDWEGIDDEQQEAMDKEAAQVAGTSEFYKFDVGEHAVRFLPRRKGAKTHAQIVHEHFVDTADGGRASFACPRNMSKGKISCPLCDEADALKKSRNPVDGKRARQMYPRMRVYANVIVRGREAEGAKVVGMSRTLWDDVKKLKHKFGDYTNPTEKGFDVLISREGTGPKDTKYKAEADRNDSPLADDEDEAQELFDSQWPLEVRAVIPAPDELAELLGIEQRPARRVLGAGRKAATGSRARSSRTAQDDVGSGRSGRTVDADYSTADDDDVPI